MEVKPETIIKEAREKKGLTQTELAAHVGIGLRMYQIIESGKFPKYKKEQITTIENVLGISIYAMIYESLSDHETNNIATSSTPKIAYIDERRNKKNETKEFRVPLVTVKARAGYVTSYDNTDVINSLEKYAVPPGVTYIGAIWRYFEVDGDSMEPALVTGDYVLCSQVPQDDWENIRNFYVHVLVTDTEVMIKRIFVKETGEWVLISDNETHKQKFFDVSTLKELWVFRRLIKKTISAKKVFKINI